MSGSRTAEVAAAGGQKLHEQLQALLALHPLDHVLYALTSSQVAFLLCAAATQERADELADVMARDAKAGVRENWDRHADLRAAMALFSAPGSGRVQ